jgi:(E)-4-hydroxy-3-methylbut-2-enyl-diphosphate synthase
MRSRKPQPPHSPSGASLPSLSLTLPSARRKTRTVSLGPVAVGGDSPVSVQSMTKTDTRDFDRTLSEIRALQVAGCDIVRVAVPDMAAAATLRQLKLHSPLPLVADIHFDHRLALAAIEAGVDGLRLNPGNIGPRWKVEEIAKAARDRGVVIRVGVNAGSLEKDLLARHGSPTPEAMVESAIRQVRILEELHFDRIKVSLKAFSLSLTVAANRLFSRQYDYPLHLGITAAGPTFAGTIRSAIGLGLLLAEGIGDTIRVSLTADPVEEVRVGHEVLHSLGLRQRGPTIVSCPSCGRAEIDIPSLVKEVQEKLQGLQEPLHIAVMGCPVNGPGEARAADVGIAGGKAVGLLFSRGQIVRKVAASELADALVEEVSKLGKGERSDALV